MSPRRATITIKLSEYNTLQKIAELANELCIAVDNEADDIGGSRPSMVILKEIGPLTDKWEHKT